MSITPGDQWQEQAPPGRLVRVLAADVEHVELRAPMGARATLPASLFLAIFRPLEAQA